MGVVDAPEVIVAASREEAVSAFGDGSDVTVVAGGTIVMPDITHGRLRPRRALLIGRAGLSGVQQRERPHDDRRRRRRSPSSQDAVEPLGTCARGLADLEIRGQATLGGNLCAPPGVETPRGDLQAALLVLDAQVRSDRRRRRAHRAGRGLPRRRAPPGGSCSTSSSPTREAGASAERAPPPRPRLHDHARLRRPRRRRAARRRLGRRARSPCAAARSRRAVADGADAAAAAERVLDDVTPQDDALASSWYRGRTLPVLVRRALDDLR